VVGEGNFDSTIDVIFPFISLGHVSCWLTNLIICRVSIVVTFVLSGVAIELLFASLLLELL
jgi:hypothetical protein